MISFPGAFSKGGMSMYQIGKIDKEPAPEVDRDADDAFKRVYSKNLRLTPEVTKYIWENDNNFTNFEGYIPIKQIKSWRHDAAGNKLSRVEDPFKMDLGLLQGMNTYKFMYQNVIKQMLDSWKVKEEGKNKHAKSYMQFTNTAASPSLMNPQFAISSLGFSPDVSLLNDVRSGKEHSEIPDCSIKNLLSSSNHPTGRLGNARYRLVDFMYCKYLGKVPNNRLITLRRFAHPVGDHIYKFASTRGAAEKYGMQTTHDTGRLVSWFDTDDNKLEDICHYEMKMSWKELNSKIQEIDSKEDNSESRGILGMALNSVNPAYNNTAANWNFGSNNIFASIASKMGMPTGGGSDNNDVLRMSANNNKIYTPPNTVQDTHLYEGRLTLSQEFTLNFSYTLRAYENINPKSAMLDLIGNILEVTYQRGRFWGGSRRFIGSPQNKEGWKKANDMIDNAWTKIGGIVSALANGSIDFSEILGSIQNVISSAWSTAKEAATKLWNSAKEGGLNGVMKGFAEGLTKLNEATGFSEGLKGTLKNALGRPAMYAMDSLLSGENCGFWHLTVGNPFNPIMCIGNLIMTSSSVTHSGPLGIDDFPTEIKVSCTLKPGRSRDATEIGRYYTQGMGSIYQPKMRQSGNRYHKFGGGGKIKTWVPIKDKKGRIIKMVQEEVDIDTAVGNIDQMTKDYAAILDKIDISYQTGEIKLPEPWHKMKDKQKAMSIIEKLNPENLSVDIGKAVAQQFPKSEEFNDDDWGSTHMQNSIQGVMFMAGTYDPLHYTRSGDEIS